MHDTIFRQLRTGDLGRLTPQPAPREKKLMTKEEGPQKKGALCTNIKHVSTSI
jgi:hypothetical protein